MSDLEPPYTVPPAAYPNTAIRYAGVPPGVISSYGGSSAPEGWHLCDGSQVLISENQDLYNAIGGTFNTGAESSGYFRLPDLRGRVVVARNSADTQFDTLGETGGAKTHTLTEAELAQHSHANTVGGGNTGGQSATHSHDAGAITGNTGGRSASHTHGKGTYNTDATGSHSHTLNAQTDATDVGGGFNTGWKTIAGGTERVSDNAGIHSHSISSGDSSAETTDHNHSMAHDHTMGDATADHTHGFTPTISNANAGSNTPHNNLQPYMVLNAIIKR